MAVAFWLWGVFDGGWDATVDLPRGREVMYTASFTEQFLVSGVVGLVGGIPFAGVWTMFATASRRAIGPLPTTEGPPPTPPSG